MFDSRKIVLILVGPKGSGKTHIGGILQQQLGFHFLQVEPLFIAAYDEGLDNSQAYARVGRHIHHLLTDDSTDCLVFETLGASPELQPVLESLRSRHEVRLIRLRVPLSSCRQRVLSRSKKDHIPVSDDRLDAINVIADRIEMSWDLELDNSGPLSGPEIVCAVQTLLGGPGLP